MTVFDCFCYCGEKELLEIRLNEFLNSKHPVVHVLIESKFTFSGKEKPLYFDKSKESFAEWPIISITVNEFPETDNPWEREKYQRNMIQGALKFLLAKDNDTVIISDVDEIPSHKAVDIFCGLNDTEFASLMMKKYGYYLNYQEKDEWDRARIFRYKYLKDKTPEEIRNSGYSIAMHNAGWHWSYLHPRIREKLNSFSHTEINTPQNLGKADEFINFWNGSDMKIVDIDETYPEYLRNNISKFKHLIK